MRLQPVFGGVITMISFFADLVYLPFRIYTESIKIDYLTDKMTDKIPSLGS